MTDERREKLGRAMIVLGGVCYAIGWPAVVFGAPPAVWGPPMSLAATLWMMQWFVRP